jgi:hypothetical protein
LYEGFWKSKYPYTNTKVSRSANPICFFATEYIYSPDKEAVVVYVTYFLARKVRTDQRWDAGVGVGGGQMGIRGYDGKA